MSTTPTTLHPPRRVVLLARTADPPQPTDAEVLRDFPDHALQAVEQLWAPERAKLPAAVEHIHWDWVRKVGRPAFEFLAVVAHGQIEGLAGVGKVSVSSQLTPSLSVVYLSFLEAAPWNLRGHPLGGKYRGVGEALLEETVLLAYHRGFNGRVLLSSLPQSEEFYRRKGMTEIGLSTTEGLVQFEYTEKQALAFLATRGTTP